MTKCKQTRMYEYDTCIRARLCTAAMAASLVLALVLMLEPAAVGALVPLPEINITNGGPTLGDLDLNGQAQLGNVNVTQANDVNASSLPTFGDIREPLDSTPKPITGLSDALNNASQPISESDGVPSALETPTPLKVDDPKLPEGESVTPFNTSLFV
ncbi:hypothetical protein FVE85_3398 [Porphyridium purpureum]|uniref:Uncharacterized protein n=1 Tax=Porphyridium purpureum TaxID=35688 RepID=A0A5J4YXH0_PORPP|nr:hypothetical protein FVE85_3398 [Porphyridium purpureum]|eukprot:POR7126..scf227_4